MKFGPDSVLDRHSTNVPAPLKVVATSADQPYSSLPPSDDRRVPVPPPVTAETEVDKAAGAGRHRTWPPRVVGRDLDRNRAAAVCLQVPGLLNLVRGAGNGEAPPSVAAMVPTLP